MEMNLTTPENILYHDPQLQKRGLFDMSEIKGKLRQRPSGCWEVDMPHKGKRYRLGYYLGMIFN